MKRVTSIAVLLIFLANTMGYYIVFSYSRHLARHEMMVQIRHGLLHPDLVMLRVISPETNRNFRRTGIREISLQERMYDIVSEHRHGDTVWFYGLHDRKEERLVAGYLNFMRVTGRAGGSRHSVPVSLLVKSLISQALVQPHMSLPLTQHRPFLFPEPGLVIIPVFLARSAPPPERT